MDALTAMKQAVPEGWQLVPVEPTYEMMFAGSSVPTAIGEHDSIEYPDIFNIYKAMLAAVSPPPTFI